MRKLHTVVSRKLREPDAEKIEEHEAYWDRIRQYNESIGLTPTAFAAARQMIAEEKAKAKLEANKPMAQRTATPSLQGATDWSSFAKLIGNGALKK